MKNPLDRFAGIHILSAEKVNQSFNEDTGILIDSFNVYLPRTFAGALCFQKNVTWQCLFFDDLTKEDYIKDTIEDVVHSFANNLEYKCCLMLVNKDTIESVVKIVRQTLAISHLNVTYHLQGQSEVYDLKERIGKYKGLPLYSKYGAYQFVFSYSVYIDDDDTYGDPQFHISIENVVFNPTWSHVDKEAFQVALRHEIVSEVKDKDYKDPPYYG